jgi:hypothetical protein
MALQMKSSLLALQPRAGLLVRPVPVRIVSIPSRSPSPLLKNAKHAGRFLLPPVQIAFRSMDMVNEDAGEGVRVRSIRCNCRQQ